MRISPLFSLLAVLLPLTFVTPQASGDARLVQAVNEMVWSPALAWLQDDAVAAALARSNMDATFLSPTEIHALDTSWKQEMTDRQGDPSAPASFVSSLTGSSLSTDLRLYKEQSGGVISDIILLNYRGMSVAMTSASGRFSLANSANYKKAFQQGTVHISKSRFNPRTGQHQILISIPLILPFNMEIVGVAILMVNANILAPGFTGEAPTLVKAAATLPGGRPST